MKKFLIGALGAALVVTTLPIGMSAAQSDSVPVAGIGAAVATAAATTAAESSEAAGETTAAVPFTNNQNALTDSLETTAADAAADATAAGDAIQQVGVTFGTLISTTEGEYPPILALEARLAGHSGLYKDVAIAQVDNYVNIRTSPAADAEIVGKIYNNSGAYIDDTVENEEGNWYKIHSGSCEGYIKSKYFLTGSDAEDIASTVSTMYATITTETLRLRESASINSEAISLLSEDEKYVVAGEEGDFYKLQIDDDLCGYVMKDYVELSISFKQAISIEEEQAELARQAEIERLRQEAEEEARREAQEARSTSSSSTKKKSTSSNDERDDGETSSKKSTKEAGSTAGSVSSRRQSLCDYAESFVGELSYVYGGNSLKSGTDCSGFVHLIFQKFGISVARDSYSLRDSGETVSSGNMRPGDIICYSGHVGIYIGDGLVCHCSSKHSNPNTKISSWNYRSVVCIVNPWGD